MVDGEGDAVAGGELGQRDVSPDGVDVAEHPPELVALLVADGDGGAVEQGSEVVAGPVTPALAGLGGVDAEQAHFQLLSADGDAEGVSVQHPGHGAVGGGAQSG